MPKKSKVKWSDDVEPGDFEAGECYLRLLFAPKTAERLVKELRQGEVTSFAAKDVLRASELALAPRKDPDVARQLKKLAGGARLSPLLLVRETGHARLIVADGFHRLCAVHHLDPDEPVRCKLA